LLSSERYLSLLERGLRTPTFFVILSLAEGLNADPVALFTDAVARLRGQVFP
jgi:transcriptional regulator with XRE-family HTH domain